MAAKAGKEEERGMLPALPPERHDKQSNVSSGVVLFSCCCCN